MTKPELKYHLLKKLQNLYDILNGSKRFQWILRYLIYFNFQSFHMIERFQTNSKDLKKLRGISKDFAECQNIVRHLKRYKSIKKYIPRKS